MFACSVIAGLIFVSSPLSPPSIEGVTFASDRNSVYVPIRPLADLLGVPVGFNPEDRKVTLNGKDIKVSKVLYDGTKLVDLRELTATGIRVDLTMSDQFATVSLKDKTAAVVIKPKRVHVDLSKQQLDAYQGDLLVFSSHVSTGKIGKNTPPGEFKVGAKQRMHHSKLYNNAPMPNSVQINGHIFIHGFKSVPKRPASHGCIRVPLRAARWFYDWVDTGTPVSIVGKWEDGKKTGERSADVLTGK